MGCVGVCVVVYDHELVGGRLLFRRCTVGAIKWYSLYISARVAASWETAHICISHSCRRARSTL
jgi:hypothetical protein